jgi:tRNA A-37 threonylcarbamoyl transferase component Bud32
MKIYKLKTDTKKFIYAIHMSNNLVCLGPVFHSSVGEFRPFIYSYQKCKKIQNKPIIQKIIQEVKKSKKLTFIVEDNTDPNDFYLFYVIVKLLYNYFTIEYNYDDLFYKKLFHVDFSPEIFKLVKKMFSNNHDCVKIVPLITKKDYKNNNEIRVSKLNIPNVVKITKFFIVKSSKNLFDSKSIKKRYKITKKAKKIKILLNTLEDVGTTLVEIVKIPINYLDENIILSNFSLCLIMNFNGFSNMNKVKKNLGKIVDTLILLNNQGVIHNDLHINNILFTSTNDFTIIDFGECIFINDLEKIILYYKTLFPTFYNEHKQEIKKLEFEPTKLFNIWSAFDLYTLTLELKNQINDLAIKHLTDLDNKNGNFNVFIKEYLIKLE